MTAENMRSIYMDRQREWAKSNQIKSGTRVGIIGKSRSWCQGWREDWITPMDSCVGKIGCVDAFILEDNGVLVMVDGFGSWNYPYFVLEVI